ncbi:MAG TPA: hypothetical protein VE954_33380 [Oligoflexus sp.]|nr:hypothetical protein [Oligoflexus sp.]
MIRFPALLSLLASVFCGASLYAQGTVVVPPEPKPAVTYADIADIVLQNCLGCHSADVAFGDVVLDTEENLKSLSKQASVALKLGVMPMGDEGFKDTPDGQLLIAYLDSLQSLVYADIAPILQTNCVSCHSGPTARKGVRLDTEAFAIQNASRALIMLGEARMPPRKPSFKASDDGQLLLSWFQNPLPTPKPVTTPQP